MGTSRLADEVAEQFAELREELEALRGLRQAPDVLPQSSQRTTAPRSVRRSLVHRYGRQALPVTFLAGCEAAGAAFHHTPYGAAVSIAASAGAGSLWWRIRGGRIDRTEEYAYTAICWAAATGWVTEAAIMGAGRTDTRLWVLGAALSLPWWVHHRVRPGGTRRDDAERAPDWKDEIRARWAARVSCPDGALTESRLLQIEAIRGGWMATIELLKGNCDRAITAVKDIGAALKLRADEINVEPHPGGLHLAYILVTPENPLAELHQWTGPNLDLATGVSTIGAYTDLKPVKYRHWRRGSGPVHTLIAGCTNSGKSALVKMLLAEERHSGLVVSYLLDPQRGQSYSTLKKTVHRFAGTIADARKALYDLRNRMYARNELMSTIEWIDEKGRRIEGIEDFTPGDVRHGLPLISCTIDEAQIVLADDVCCALVAEIIAMSRKCGIKFRLITQVPLLGSLGDSQNIKDAVAAGNVIVLRTANSLSGMAAFNGYMPVDACELPKEWPDGSTTSGIGYVFGPGADRPTKMRTLLIDDPYHWATTGEPAVLDDVVLPEPEPAEEPDSAASDGSLVVLTGGLEDDSPAVSQDAQDRVLAWFASHREQRETHEVTAHLFTTHQLAPRTARLALTKLTGEGLLLRVKKGHYIVTDLGVADARRRQLVA